MLVGEPGISALCVPWGQGTNISEPVTGPGREPLGLGLGVAGPLGARAGPATRARYGLEQ